MDGFCNAFHTVGVGYFWQLCQKILAGAVELWGLARHGRDAGDSRRRG